MKKCPDYTAKHDYHYSETNQDEEHPNSCLGCVYLEYIPYECWNCKNNLYIEDIPYPSQPENETEIAIHNKLMKHEMEDFE